MIKYCPQIFLESCHLRKNSYIDGFSTFWGKYDDKEKCKYAVRENFRNAKGISWNAKNNSCFAKHETKQFFHGGMKWDDWWSCLFAGRVRLITSILLAVRVLNFSETEKIMIISLYFLH